MTWVDWLILAVLFISMLTAFLRGMTREAVALMAWLLGAYLAFTYTPHLQVLLESQIQTPEFRYLIVFIVILIIFLILGAIGGRLLSRIVSALGLTSLDKTLGVIFGLARGLLLVVIFIMMANFTPMVNNDNWKSSWFIMQLQGPADELLAWIDRMGFLPKNNPSDNKQTP